MALRDCTVAVVMGGTSAEREVSLASGTEIARALAHSEDARRPRTTRCFEITAEGRFVEHVSEARSEKDDHVLRECTREQFLRAADLYFLGLHGGPGEDGTLQGWLQECGCTFTGSGVGASALCMDKEALRALAASIGVRVAPGVLVHEPSEALAAAHTLPAASWFVKPRGGGSSVDTFHATTDAELTSAAERVCAGGDDCLIEARIEGVELSCGVLGNARGDLRVLPPIEIQPSAEHFFDYDQKYSPDGAREVCPAESVDPGVVERVRADSARLHRLARCSGYSRVDFIAAADGAPVLLEINTLPGMTARSLLPQMARVDGLEFDRLCLEILELALADREGRS